MPHTQEVPSFRHLQLIRSRRNVKEEDLVTDSVFELGMIQDPKSFAQERDIRILHAHHGNLGALLLPFRRKAGIPMVTSFRGKCATTGGQLKEYLATLPTLFRESERVFPVCNSLADRVVRLGCPPEKIRVLYGGIDVSKFAYRPSRDRGKCDIVSVGRLVEKKGHHVLLEAFSKIRSVRPDATLTVIGAGNGKGKLAKLAARLRLGDSFRLRDPIRYDEMPEEFRKYDIFCAPSVTAADGDVEGIPNTLKEAMATGLPVISTFHAGIPELVTSGLDGILVKEGSVGALAQALEYFVANPRVWETYGAEARKTVENRFNVERQLAVQARYYEEILS
jgi:glycosyltransferase involved in cell wall biosynthesis